ncbi:MAG: hypothetical protein J5795_06275 [Lachnospiraceae bacterium]|nr:hypothetical protein [Lachnospiraceae bacterium]
MNEQFLAYASIISFNLVATLIIEVPLAILLGVRNRKDIGLVFWLNCLTNPVLVTILYLLTLTSLGDPVVNGILFLSEIVVVVTEGMVYRRYLQRKPMNPFLLSFLLNAVSCGAGLLWDSAANVL